MKLRSEGGLVALPTVGPLIRNEKQILGFQADNKKNAFNSLLRKTLEM